MGLFSQFGLFGQGGSGVSTNLFLGYQAVAVSTLISNNTIIGVTDTAAPRTITLDTFLLSAGRVVIINDESGGAAVNNITIATQGAETIDGQLTVTISANFGTARLYSNGINWFVI